MVRHGGDGGANRRIGVDLDFDRQGLLGAVREAILMREARRGDLVQAGRPVPQRACAVAAALPGGTGQAPGGGVGLRTAAGRLVAVVWTVRGARVRVVTAYPASRRQQVAYEEAKYSNSGAEVSPDPEFQD